MASAQGVGEKSGGEKSGSGSSSSGASGEGCDDGYGIEKKEVFSHWVYVCRKRIEVCGLIRGCFE